jgi:hypothetical protein
MWQLILSAAMAAVLCLPAAAKHGKPGKPDKHGRDEERVEAYTHFRAGDSAMIGRHCRVKSLPPGLQKKLYRTGHLPPGWEKNFAPFPVVVEQQLPPVCVGCRRGLIGNFAVVFDTRTSVILDIAIVR